MGNDSKLVTELKRLEQEYGADALKAAYTSRFPTLTPQEEIVLDNQSLVGCLSGSIADRNQYIDDLINSAKGKKVVVTEEFRNGLYEAMVHPESQAPITVDGWFTTTYLTLAQRLGIEYTSEELRETLFKNRSIPLGVGLVLEEVVRMGARIEPEEIGEYLQIHDMEVVAENNLFWDKTRTYIELKYADCIQKIKDTEQQITEKAEEFKEKLGEFMRRSWLYRTFHKPPEDVIPWLLGPNLQMLRYDEKVLSACIRLLNR